MASIADALGKEIYEACRQFFAWCFPGSGGINDEMMDGLVRTLYRNHGTAAVQHGWPGMPAELLAPTRAEVEHKAAREGAPTYPLYRAQATHHRVRSMTTTSLKQHDDVAFNSEFGEILPVVRVPLPHDYFDGQGPVRQTRIGVVDLAKDHILGSLEAIKNHDFRGSKLPFQPGHVELITPARTGPLNWRFGAIAAYLCYHKQGDPAPAFYILEAGMATGEAKEVYLAQSMEETIAHQSNYHPTAYSNVYNTYTGKIEVLGNEPTRLWIQATPPEKKDHYIQISVLYTVTPIVENDPLLLLLHAAMRIARVGEKMGVPSGVPIPAVLSLIAGSLTWMIEPGYPGSGSSASH